MFWILGWYIQRLFNQEKTYHGVWTEFVSLLSYPILLKYNMAINKEEVLRDQLLWIYWCKRNFISYTYKLNDRKLIYEEKIINIFAVGGKSESKETKILRH